MKVKVKIAVAVDPDGLWIASGYGKQMDWDEQMVCMMDDLAPGEARYWVTAELDVPEVKEIEGECQPVEIPTNEADDTTQSTRTEGSGTREVDR
jgi:hypothetical protein